MLANAFRPAQWYSDWYRATVSAPAEVDIPADQTKTGGNNFADADVVIVRDFEAVMAQVDQIFCEVDVKPKQVSIEAMILSVKLSDEFKMGVDFSLLRNDANVRLISGKPILLKPAFSK